MEELIKRFKEMEGKEVTVTIARKDYKGYRYRHNSYDTLYLLGNLPPSYKRSGRTLYKDSEGKFWFVGGYATEEVAQNPSYSSYHPFGAHFYMMQEGDMKFSQEYPVRPFRHMAITSEKAL